MCGINTGLKLTNCINANGFINNTSNPQLVQNTIIVHHVIRFVATEF